MNVTQRRERFRAVVLEADRCIYPAPVHDPISARIAEDLGFEIGVVTGPVAQASILGAPNHHVVIMNASELAHLAYRICRASDISLYMGAHDGYGNALNVMRTVEDLEAAGVSALPIDDMIEPWPFGAGLEGWAGYRTHLGEMERLVPFEEAVGRIKAALAARKDSSLVIIARNSALYAGDLPEAIRRMEAYEKIGADAVHLDLGRATGPLEHWMEGVEAVRASSKLPLLQGDAASRFDKQFLDANFCLAGRGNLSFLGAVKGIYDVMNALRDGRSPEELTPMLATEEVLAQVTRQEQYSQWIKEFMR